MQTDLTDFSLFFEAPDSEDEKADTPFALTPRAKNILKRLLKEPVGSVFYAAA